MNKFTFGEKYYIHSIISTGILFFFYLFGINNSFLYSSILDYKNIKSDKFSGTIYPIEFVPNPIKLSYDERKRNYNDIESKDFIKTPIYNPNIFGKNIESLDTNSDEYSQTITQRVIYTVPYMGDYNFDYKEFAGSHPGIDIVAPEGTPIKNIAAGVVVDIGYQPAGYGNYVLVKHNGVPLPNGKTGDIYSLYAHMSKSIVIAGNKIDKGELIGYVGYTGEATVSHLHFQIDLETAPFHPYWPFTSNDMKMANVGFFDGVNIGLGRESAILYTINPLKFVNDNLTNLSILTQNTIVENEN
ncbi:MAG: M23 family metallopeptidase, partial [Candidatus Gracilibacteria bacterium]|nr:M23 family metallopeptidase [Candidatus Gracilibacteria bacterium]